MSGEGGPIPASGHMPFVFDRGEEWPMPGVAAQSREKALAAAHAAQEAAAELIRFAREGSAYRRPPFGDVEVVEMLADAAKLALEIESLEHDGDGHPDDAEERNRFLGALTQFLEGWAP